MAASKNNNGIGKHLDTPSLLVILLTLVLFSAALVVKGLGHDLLLEAGVFLVSVKLIMMAYKTSVMSERLTDDLASMRAALSRLERSLTAGPRPVASGEFQATLRPIRSDLSDRSAP